MMIHKRSVYLVHRWIALAVSFQLLAWSIGGFVFSVLDIRDVRGETDRAIQRPAPLEVELVKISAAEAVAVARSHGWDGRLTRIRLRQRLGAVMYELFVDDDPACAVNAVTGAYVPTISPAEAETIALADFAHQAVVESVRLFKDTAPNEYRGGLLPAYRVVLDHPSEPHMYVSAVTGQVTKRRNNLWRTFDFFWMLHIMDYGERENFNHWLLTAMSVLAILASLSGLVLWGWRLPKLRRSH